MKELIARNLGLISPEIQEKIEKARVLFVGCGLGSQIAVLAARTGFTHFELWDGDVVEKHNLNRQAFDRRHLGKNKVEATAEILLAINPDLEIQLRVRVFPRFMRTFEEIREAVGRADLVINTADPDEAVYHLDKMAAEKGIPSFFPMNVGFGGFVLVFAPQSQRLEEMVGGRILGDECFIRILQTSVSHLPKSFRRELERFRPIDIEIPPVPQIGVAAYLTSSLVVTAMVRWLAGDPTLPVAPQPLWLCSWV